MHPTTVSELDRLIKELNNHKDDWARLELAAKIPLFEEVGRLVAEHAEGWVTIAADIKSIPLDSPLVGEEWASGPWATLVTINQTVETLKALAAEDEPPVNRNGLRNLPDGRLAAHPTDVATDVRTQLGAASERGGPDRSPAQHGNRAYAQWRRTDQSHTAENLRRRETTGTRRVFRERDR